MSTQTHPEPKLDSVGDNSTTIRSQVADAYANALSQAQQANAGCCGASETPFGTAAKIAGYDAELEEHDGAAVTSFGCGNPLAFSGVEPGQTVVDLGSGAGFDLLIAAKKVGPEGRVIGVDMTDAMIETARANAARAGAEQIEVRKGLIEAMPLADDSTDWVISNCVINLSPEKERVFAEIHRVLKPGGHFSISDIVVEELPAAIRQHSAAYAACVSGAIREEAYLDGLRAAGLDEVTVTERQVYTKEQIVGIIGSDLESFGLDPQLLSDHLDDLVGKVWSAKFQGQKPSPRVADDRTGLLNCC
ncbi:MAG: arsenite methyltransferase [Acidobacteriota bacterium]